MVVFGLNFPRDYCSVLFNLLSFQMFAYLISYLSALV